MNIDPSLRNTFAVSAYSFIHIKNYTNIIQTVDTYNIKLVYLFENKMFLLRDELFSNCLYLRLNRKKLLKIQVRNQSWTK